MESTERETRSVREYVEIEADEKVTHAEKVSSERIFDTRHDVWDVHTQTTRWWVVTNPTNLYEFDKYPSMDQVLSFHVGLATRVLNRQRRGNDDKRQVARLASTWRRFGQATDAFDDADEAEEFQAVGMRLRECLLTLIREIASDEYVPQGQARPKAADFNGWTDLACNALADGRLRSYMKGICTETWNLVQELTHDRSAVRFDAGIALDAVANVVGTIGITLLRREMGVPERCPRCGSYRIVEDYRMETDETATVCESCGWEGVPQQR